MYLFYCDSMKVVNNLNLNEANSKCSDSTIHFMEVEPPSFRIVHSIWAVHMKLEPPIHRTAYKVYMFYIILLS